MHNAGSTMSDTMSRTSCPKILELLHNAQGKDHEALEGPMTRGRLKQTQHVIETRLVICIAAIDDD